MKVVTFGEIMLRLGAPDYLRLNQCNQFDISFAGAEANVAVSLANYGVKAEYITRLPKHPIADKCISELLSYRVDVSRVIRGGKRIGILYLETGSNMRSSCVYYDREDSSFATIGEHEIDCLSWWLVVTLFLVMKKTVKRCSASSLRTLMPIIRRDVLIRLHSYRCAAK